MSRYVLSVICLLLQIVQTQQCEDHLVKETKQQYSGFQVLSITTDSEEQRNYLTKLVKDEDDKKIEFWNLPTETNQHTLLQVGPDKVDKVETSLKNENITYKIVYKNLQSAIDSEQLINGQSQHYVLGHINEFDMTRYHKLSEIDTYLKVLEKDHPQLIQIEVIGQSFENRDIKVVKISENPAAAKPIIFLECGCHAREWISPAVSIYLINKLIESQTSGNGTLLRNYDWYIIPVLNPDGYNYTWFEDRLWRKNRRTFGAVDSSFSLWPLKPFPTCSGVDLNRNFDIGTVTNDNDKCSQVFSGTEPFSEPETKALRDYLLKIQNRIKLIISLHSYSQVWVTPYMYKVGGPVNYDQLLKAAEAASNVMEKINGNEYTYGAGSLLMYPSAGTSADWYYEKLKVSYTFILELPDKGQFGFLLPKSQIIPVGKEVWEGLHALIDNI